MIFVHLVNSMMPDVKIIIEYLVDQRDRDRFIGYRGIQTKIG